MSRLHHRNTLNSWLPSGRRRKRESNAKARLELLPLEDRLAPAIAIAGAGTGLIANYYSDANLTNLVQTRIDGGVNFNWGAGSPGAAVPADHFSVRWTGQVQAQFTESYTFSTVSAGGVRLWVNGQKVIDDWADQTATEDSATIALQAGETYDIKLEYANNTGSATVGLFWSSASTSRAAVPATQLFPSGGWLEADFGSTVGTARSSGSTFTVQGGGAFGGTADGGHFVYQSLVGDGTIVAQVTIGGGLMVRDSLNANSRAAELFVAADGVHFMARTTAGAAATDTVRAGSSASTWLKIVRDGNFIAGYSSATGVDNTWTLVGTATANFSRTVNAGFAAAGATATVTSPKITPTIAVGANLMELHDWSLNNPFVDIFKQARELYSVSGSAAGPLVQATLDSNGWATEDFIAFVQTGGINLAHVYNGTYKLSFTGRANVETWITPGGSVQNLVYNAATNTTTADVLLNASDTDPGWYFTLKFTNTAGAVRNVKLIRPGYDPANHPTFTSQFLATLEPFTTIRTMQFTRNIDNPDVNWSDRSRVTDATQTSNSGVAWEYIAEMANAAKKDIWINLPVGANDDYVRQLAILMKSLLAPDRIVYVELSNEMWNGAYSETMVNKNAAVAEVVAAMQSGTPSNLMLPGETGRNTDGSWTHQWDWAFRRQARRTKEINDIFAQVWGANAINGRVRTVLATQIANPYIGQIQLRYLDQTYGAPSQYLYAISGAPYFFIGSGDNQNNLTVDQVLNGLSAGIDANAPFIAEYSRYAQQYGLQLIAYEGGPDTFGPNNIAVKKAASLDPRMKDLTIKHLNQWFGAGGGMYAWFVAGPSDYDTQYGTWGTTNHIDNLNAPKMQGIQDVMNGPVPKATIGFSGLGDLRAIQYVGAPQSSDPYPRYLHNGATLDYLVRSPADAQYTLRLNYAAVSAGGKLRLWVNGTPVQTLDLAVTGSHYDSQWAPNDFADTQPLTINLRAGLNTVRLEVVAEGYTLNLLRFAGASQPVAPLPPVVAPPAPAPVVVPTPPAPAPAPTNQAPTIASPARVTSGAVTGKTASLSVLGADNAGEAGLTYTWATIGSAPAPVSFSVNGTNGAKSTTALFQKAGTYSIRVTVRDAAGLNTTSNLTFTVSRTMASLTLSPASNSLIAGASQQLAVSAFDQFGVATTTPISLAWSINGTGATGSVSPSGLYRASTTGNSTDTVRVTAGGVSASATMTIAPAPVVALTAAQSATPVSTGISYVAGMSSIGMTTNGYSSVVNGRLRLTSGGFQRGSAFFRSPVSISRFGTAFNWQNTNPNGEGMAFVLQGVGPTALGAGGSGLGYAGIARSLAVKFDVNGNAGVGQNMVGLTINGGTPIGPSLNLTNAGINLRSGHELRTVITYDGGVLTVSVADVVTGRSAVLSTQINLASVIGGTSAYAGFTAATGGLASTQEVLNWTFASVAAGQTMPQFGIVRR